MHSCDVLIVGGGPAGSSCAWRLVQAGLDVVVIDKATFPRDKVCAGWITPAVVATLGLDLQAYGRGRTLQPFTGFRTGAFDGELHLTDFGRPISYGIRRCEFDQYLLDRSGARRIDGHPVQTLQRNSGWWQVDDVVRARVVVGAGGHFCPVARRLAGKASETSIVVAQEVEVRLDREQDALCPIHGEWPELFFWPDLLGYGWCVRKGQYLNIGAGRLSPSHFPSALREFTEMLAARGILAAPVPSKWKGHAYLLNRTSPRRLYDDGVVLVGDAAGLALAPSGEGILAAVESGLMAAEAIVHAAGTYEASRLAPYGQRVIARFGPRATAASMRSVSPQWVSTAASRLLLGSRWLTRRVVLENWFLHVRRPALA